MIPLQLLLDATGGTVIQRGGVEQFTQFASDAREVAGGELFVAVRGVHADGHDFAVAAVAQGATGVLVEASRVGGAGSPLLAELAGTQTAIIVVPDVRLALRAYAAAVLRAWQPRVIAVAGSAGKTTTKEAIATILSQHASTFRSWRNYNDLLGVPLALGRLEPHHEFAVLELACDFPDEIATLAAMVRPEIAVILNAYATHLDGLGSEEGVANALAALPAAMQQGQMVILNPADPHLRQLGAILAQRSAAPNVRWLGSDLPAAFVPGADSAHVPHREYLTLPLRDQAGSLHRFEFPQMLGGHWADAVLAALGVAELVGIDPFPAAQVLKDFAPLPGRMRRLPGVGGLRLVDDSHNAIPAAVRAALETLRRLHDGTAPTTHIAVLGDMLNLGSAERDWHMQIGHLAPEFCDWLITRGERAEITAQAAKEAGMPAERVIVTHTAQDAANAVLTIAAQYATPPTVLIKGSPEMRMEQITERLLADPTTAPQVLDRQRSIWRRAVVAELNRPTWLEIDLDAIGQNARRIMEIVGPNVALMATLKADAYGHGALKVARTVLRNGASWLGLATVSEAAILRGAGITAPMLVYGYVPPWQAREAVKLDLRATVYALDTAQALSRAAVALDKTARVHVKIDSGMARLGLRAEDPAGIVAFVRELMALPGISVEGIYTHFATADEADQTYAHEQLRRFQAVLAALTAAKLRPPLTHAANSAATLALPEARFDIVRPGIALYGMDPSDEVPLPTGFRPALTFKTQIAQVKTVPAGEGISYGARYVTSAPERIAILPVGYADGFRRGPTNWGEVLVRGQRAPIRGRVCMDQTIVSVQHIPEARAGDEVVLIGVQGDDVITAEEIAARLGTSNYEVIAALLARVPRVTG